MTSFNSLNITGGGVAGRNSAVCSPAPTIRRDSLSSNHSGGGSLSPFPYTQPSNSNGRSSSSLSLSGGGSPRDQQQLVLRGSELVAFTGALKEMVRTNAVRATRQQALNETHAQMHAMSFFLHYCNAERSLRAKREYEQVRLSIEEGRSMLAHMSSVVASQEVALASLGSSMAEMESRAEATAERVDGLEDELAAQKASLAQAMAEYEARLAASERDMRAQEAVLARLLSVRFKMDFGLDVLLALISWYLAHNALLRVVANNVALKLLWRAGSGGLGKLVRRDRARTFVTLVQLVVFGLLLRRARRWAQEAGLHHAIGSYTKYAQFLAQMCGSTIDIVRGGAPAATRLEDPDDDSEGVADDAARSASAAAAADGHASAPVTAAAAAASSSSGVVRVSSPDFSASAALSLGRSVGATVLQGLRAGRDSLRWVLRHTVASSAHADMDVSGSGVAPPLTRERNNHVNHAASSSSSSSAAAASPPLVRPVPLSFPADSSIAAEEFAHLAASAAAEARSASSSLPPTPTRAQQPPVQFDASSPAVGTSAFHTPRSHLSSPAAPFSAAQLGMAGAFLSPDASAHARMQAAPAALAPSAPELD